MAGTYNGTNGSVCGLCFFQLPGIGEIYVPSEGMQFLSRSVTAERVLKAIHCAEIVWSFDL
jgi:hypothetical protein